MKPFWSLIVAAALLLLTLGHEWAATVVDPQPKPPTPDVVPTPVEPRPVDGLRVLLVYESKAVSPQQIAVLFSPAVEKWLNENCIDGADGWRRWDKDTDATNESEVWRALWDEARPKLKEIPCVVVVRGTAGPAQVLPETDAELLTLLKGGA